jgi:hypothetical protein
VFLDVLALAGITVQCVPHSSVPPANEDDLVDWRNAEVHRIVKERKYTGIRVVPFYEATRELHALHRGARDDRGTDCTHYCWNPVFWQPLWQAVAKAVKDDAYIKPPRISADSRAFYASGPHSSVFPFIMGCVVTVIVVLGLGQWLRKVNKSGGSAHSRRA